MPAHGLSIITARLQMCLLIFINFCNLVFLAPVAQLDRVLASEAKGRAFESRQVRHYSHLQYYHYPINTRFHIRLAIKFTILNYLVML